MYRKKKVVKPTTVEVLKEELRHVLFLLRIIADPTPRHFGLVNQRCSEEA